MKTVELTKGYIESLKPGKEMDDLAIRMLGLATRENEALTILIDPSIPPEPVVVQGVEMTADMVGVEGYFHPSTSWDNAAFILRKTPYMVLERRDEDFLVYHKIDQRISIADVYGTVAITRAFLLLKMYEEEADRNEKKCGDGT